jgi:hypothetical protein
MSDDKFQAFKVGDWQARQSRPVQKTPEEQINFEKTYPTFRQYLTTEDFSPLFQQCEKTCIELDRIIRTGNREEAEEAQEAVNAYGRSMQLAMELLELKAKFRGR